MVCYNQFGDVIRSSREWESKDYPSLRKAILQEYKEHDSYQQTYSPQFPERFKSVRRTERDNAALAGGGVGGRGHLGLVREDEDQRACLAGVGGGDIEVDDG
jgi:hypothetical protein